MPLSRQIIHDKLTKQDNPLQKHCDRKIYCSSLILPLINEVFGVEFSRNKEIVFSPDSHFLNQQDGKENKIITDTSYKIRGDEQKLTNGASHLPRRKMACF